MLFQVDWSTNLGEHARNLVVMRYSRTLAPNKHELVVIGEQSAAALDPAQSPEQWRSTRSFRTPGAEAFVKEE